MMPRPQARLLAVANSAIDSSFRQIQSDRIGGAQNDNPAPRPGELDDAKAILAEWFKFNPKINPLTLAALPSHPRTTWSKRWPLGGDPSPPADCAEVGASTRCSGPERQGMTPELPFATAAANGRDGS
jgi:hypothetical protein